jgi:hypothetical protein
MIDEFLSAEISVHVARAFDTHLLERDRAARGFAEDTADAAWASMVIIGKS